MKLLKIAMFCLLGGLLTYCGDSSKGDSQEVDSEETSDANSTEMPAVCVWDQISVRKEPSSKSKWLTSINIGEKLTALGTTAVDSADKNREYVQVRLADGTEGWSIADFIIPNATVGVFLEDNVIYKRPDLLTKTDDKFSQMDIVAIKSTDGDWMEVVGKRTGATWLTSGWVKNGNLSQSDIDVAVAKFAKPVLAESSSEKKIGGLQEIVDNADFASSAFIPVLHLILENMQLEMEEPLAASDTLAGEAEM